MDQTGILRLIELRLQQQQRHSIWPFDHNTSLNNHDRRTTHHRHRRHRADNRS